MIVTVGVDHRLTLYERVLGHESSVFFTTISHRHLPNATRLSTKSLSKVYRHTSYPQQPQTTNASDVSTSLPFFMCLRTVPPFCARAFAEQQRLEQPHRCRLYCNSPVERPRVNETIRPDARKVAEAVGERGDGGRIAVEREVTDAVYSGVEESRSNPISRDYFCVLFMFSSV